jgi:ABC-type iron transport system FetAB permease component
MATEKATSIGPPLAVATDADTTQFPESARRALNYGLLISATRCTLQYVLLPFVLPWIGVAAAIPRWVTIALCLLALGMIGRNVRIMWRLRHARRWSYLAVAGVVGVSLLLFTVVDLHTLLGI